MKGCNPITRSISSSENHWQFFSAMFRCSFWKQVEFMHIHQKKGLTPSNDIGQSSNHMENPIYSDPPKTKLGFLSLILYRARCLMIFA